MFYLVFLRLINWIIELESEILFYTKYFFLAIDIFLYILLLQQYMYKYIFKLIKKSQKQKENEECTVEG